MPARLLHPSMMSSKNLARCSSGAFRLFAMLIPADTTDDYGCFHADPYAVRADLFRLNVSREVPENVTSLKVVKWLDELEANGLIDSWKHAGAKRTYAAFLTWDRWQRIRRNHEKFNRKTPKPPKEVLRRMSPELQAHHAKAPNNSSQQWEGLKADKAVAPAAERKPLAEQKGLLGDMARALFRAKELDMVETGDDIIAFNAKRKRFTTATDQDVLKAWACYLIIADRWANGWPLALFTRHMQRRIAEAKRTPEKARPKVKPGRQQTPASRRGKNYERL